MNVFVSLIILSHVGRPRCIFILFFFFRNFFVYPKRTRRVCCLYSSLISYYIYSISNIVNSVSYENLTRMSCSDHGDNARTSAYLIRFFFFFKSKCSARRRSCVVAKEGRVRLKFYSTSHHVIFRLQRRFRRRLCDSTPRPLSTRRIDEKRIFFHTIAHRNAVSWRRPAPLPRAAVRRTFVVGDEKVLPWYKGVVVRVIGTQACR